jgi:hypothetical protein
MTRTSSKSAINAPKSASRASLKVVDPRARNVDPEAIAPNGVVKVSRPRRGELKFNAGAAAIVERDKANEAQHEKEQKIKEFQKVSRQRAAAAMTVVNTARSQKRVSSEASPKRKADFSEAMQRARQGIKTFEKIAQ